MEKIVFLIYNAFNSSEKALVFVVWGIYIGVLVGLILSLVSRVYSHRLVSALIREKAVDPGSAKTLGSLGLGKAFILRPMMKKGAPLRKYIKSNGREMYLPEEKRIGAEIRFSREKHPILTFILAAVAFFFIACLVIYFLPQLIGAYKNIKI